MGNSCSTPKVKEPSRSSNNPLAARPAEAVAVGGAAAQRQAPAARVQHAVGDGPLARGRTEAAHMSTPVLNPANGYAYKRAGSATAAVRPPGTAPQQRPAAPQPQPASSATTGTSTSSGVVQHPTASSPASGAVVAVVAGAAPNSKGAAAALPPNLDRHSSGAAPGSVAQRQQSSPPPASAPHAPPPPSPPRAHMPGVCAPPTAASPVPQQPAAATPDTTDDEAARHEAEQVQAPAVAAPDTEIAPTHTITNWTLGKLIGQGAFGAVYQALDNDTGLLFAIKMVAIPKDEGARGRVVSHMRDLEKEVGLLRALHHPNIVRYLGTCLQADNLLIFLEFVPGGSIASLLLKFGPLPEQVIRKYVHQILQGLEYIHKKRVVHRDIKGANILVDHQGNVKLADFGASRAIEDLATVGGGAGGCKSIRGTPCWMAPEVIKQTGHGRPADIWSLGCVVIEMATGKPPWSDYTNQVAAMFHVAATKEPPPLPPTLSPEARDFLLLCFNRVPRDRPNATRLLRHPWMAGVPGAAASQAGVAGSAGSGGAHSSGASVMAAAIHRGAAAAAGTSAGVSGAHRGDTPPSLPAAGRIAAATPQLLHTPPLSPPSPIKEEATISLTQPLIASTASLQQQQRKPGEPRRVAASSAASIAKAPGGGSTAAGAGAMPAALHMPLGIGPLAQGRRTSLRTHPTAVSSSVAAPDPASRMQPAAAASTPPDETLCHNDAAVAVGSQLPHRNATWQQQLDGGHNDGDHHHNHQQQSTLTLDYNPMEEPSWLPGGMAALQMRIQQAEAASEHGAARLASSGSGGAGGGEDGLPTVRESVTSSATSDVCVGVDVEPSAVHLVASEWQAQEGRVGPQVAAAAVTAAPAPHSPRRTGPPAACRPCAKRPLLQDEQGVGCQPYVDDSEPDSRPCPDSPRYPAPALVAAIGGGSSLLDVYGESDQPDLWCQTLDIGGGSGGTGYMSIAPVDTAPATTTMVGATAAAVSGSLVAASGGKAAGAGKVGAAAAGVGRGEQAGVGKADAAAAARHSKVQRWGAELDEELAAQRRAAGAGEGGRRSLLGANRR